MTPNRREFEKQCALFHITDLFIDPVLTNAAISCVFKEPYSSNKIGF